MAAVNFAELVGTISSNGEVFAHNVSLHIFNVFEEIAFEKLKTKIESNAIHDGIRI